MRLCAAILLAALFVARPLSTADAGTAVLLDVPGLAERADLIVEGRVVAARSELSPSGLILTAWDVSVDRAFFGGTEGLTTLRLPGGVHGSYGMVIPGMPRLATGEDVLLFLTEPGPQTFRMPIGLAQGKFRVETDLATGARVLRRDQSDLELVGPGGQVQPASSNASIDYADAVAQIHQGLARKSAGEGR